MERAPSLEVTDLSFHLQHSDNYLLCVLQTRLFTSESLFSCFRVRLKKKKTATFQSCFENDKYSKYLVCSKCSINDSNSLFIFLLFAVSVPTLAEWLAHGK